MDNSFNVHEVGTQIKRLCFRLPENAESKLKAWARNDRTFDPQSAAAPGLLPVRRDQEYLKQVLNYVLKTPESASEPPSQPVVLDPNWEKAPWANLPLAELPAGWTERGKPVLIVLPISPKSISNSLGPWLAQHVPQNRNMIRFLLPKAEAENFYDDRDLLITARCALLANEWKEGDPQYEKLHRKYEGLLKTDLKGRFDRYLILSTWDYQSPKNCTFHEEAHGAAGAEVTSAIERHVAENYFAPEDFEAFILGAASRGDTMRQVLALLREPPLPGSTAIPYLGDVFTYDQVLKAVAKDKIAINITGRWIHREPGESYEEALERIRQRAWCGGQAMFAVQLGEPSQVGGAGVVISSPPPVVAPYVPSIPPAGTPNPMGGPTQPEPISVPLPPSQPVIRQSLGAKSGVNLLGDIEKWALPDRQRVVQAALTFASLSVKELREICAKLPPKVQAELQLTLSPEGGESK